MMGTVGKALIIVLAIAIPGGIPAYLIYLSGKKLKEKNARESGMVGDHGENATEQDDQVQDIGRRELLREKNFRNL